METNGEPNFRKFSVICLRLSGETTANKLKQLKFLLQDVATGIDIRDKKTFLDLIKHLEAQKKLLHDDEDNQKEAQLLLCELFDAVSLNNLADDICSEFSIERAPSRQTRITPFKKFLVKLSDDLNTNPLIDMMKKYLEAEGYDILHHSLHQDMCSLDVLQAMIQACLISSEDLSLLKNMMRYCSRIDLVQRIDAFNTKKVPYGLRNLPRDMVQRPSEVNEILDLLQAGNNRVGVVGVRSGDVIGIRGMGGIGKTVLAQAIAWSVKDARQVIWLDIGQDPDCLALINTLVKALGGTSSFSDISVAQAWIRQNTTDKDCLVVLDDVWNVEHASEFDYLSGNCQLLITTRDADVVRGLQGSALYELQIMPQDKARALLYQSARVTPIEQSKFTSNMQKIVVQLLEQCRGLPLALSLVGSNLIDTRTEQDWQDLLDDLKNADLEELRLLFPKDAYPYDNLLAAINVSFQRLEEIAQQLFLYFAIFPEDTDIPTDILELFWSSQRSRTVTSNARARRRILRVLETKSLIQKGPELDGKNSYRVHDLLLDFARGKLRNTIKDVQREFLATLRGKCVNGEWPTFTGNNDYFFKYLPYHLSTSGQDEELLRLLFNLRWLEQKVKKTNLPSLISDFRFVDQKLYEIKLLKSSLMLSADVIEKTPRSIGPQLLGRLLSCGEEYPRVNRLLEIARETCARTCHLIPLYSCLSEPVGPLIKNFTKHTNTVFSLATSVSPDDTIVISASADTSIKIHELETGKELQVLKGHTMAVYCLALSHDGTKLASGSFDTTARLWNMDTFQLQFVLETEGGGYVNAIDFSADDQRLFTGSNDGNLRVWCVSTGAVLNTIPAHDGHIRGLCTTKDGRHIATASLDHTIKVWDAESLNSKATLEGHTDTVYAVVATTDSRMLVSAAGDNTLRVWDLQKFEEIRTLSPKSHRRELYSVAVSQDMKYIISGGDDTIVRLWCFETGDLLFSFKGHSQSVRFVTIIPDGTKALSGSQDKSFRVWDLDTSSYSNQAGSRGHPQDVLDVAITQDGSKSVSSSIDGSLKIWECDTAEDCFTMQGHTRRAISVAVSTDGRYFASLALDSLIKVWDLADGNEITKIEVNREIRSVRFNPSGVFVIIACDNDLVYIWDWQNCDVPKCITLPYFTTSDITCDNNVAYTCSRNDEVCKIDLHSLAVSPATQGPNPSCTSMVILPKGEAILTGIVTINGFIYWEFSSSREIRYNADHADDSIVTAVDITSNGKFALSGSSSGTVSLVNLESSKVVRTYASTESGAGIRLVCVLRDDASFVLVDEENRVELRYLDNHVPGVVLAQPPVKVTCVTTLGLSYILFGCANGKLLLFDYHGHFEDNFKKQVHDEAVSQVSSYPDNEFLYFASGSQNGSVKVWFVTKTVPPLCCHVWSRDNVHPHPITALAFVPDSKDIVSGSHGNVVHQINAEGIVRTYQYKSYGIAALRVVGDTLIGACIRGFSVVKWRLSDGEVAKAVNGGAGREQVSCVHLAADHVVSKGSHHTLMCWNLKTGATIHRLRGHSHDIRVLAFIPGGEFILSGSRDKTLKLWDLRAGRFVEEFHFEHYVLAIACATNGIVCVGLQGGQVCFLGINNLASPATRTV